MYAVTDILFKVQLNKMLEVVLEKNLEAFRAMINIHYKISFYLVKTQSFIEKFNEILNIAFHAS